MTNTEILNEYFIWEENNSTEHQKNYENKNVSEINDTITNTKIDSTQIDWRSITDPKLRKEMRLKAKSKRYREKYKDKIKERRIAYYRSKFNVKVLTPEEKEKKILLTKLSDRLRQRLGRAIERHSRRGSAVRDLGCTMDEFKTYLESKFQPGMTWDNYGYYGWHIDHIKPLSSFDLTDKKQLLEACHYTNLQPLWAKDNLSKHAKF